MHHYEEYLRKSKRPLLSDILKKKKDDEKKPSILSSFDNDFNYGDDDLIFYLEMDTVNTNKKIS